MFKRGAIVPTDYDAQRHPRDEESTMATIANQRELEVRATPSYWTDSYSVPELPRLTRDLETDVCVVGAGICGLSTAFLLARAGKRVAVIDDGPIGGGQTRQTTAHLSSVLDDRIYEAERLFGLTAAKLATESHIAAIDQVEQIVQHEQIACDFERCDGYLFAPPRDRGILDREFEAARRTKALDVTFVDRAPIPGFDTGPCLRFGRQARLHPLKYLVGLAQGILRLGGSIYGDSHVSHIGGGPKAEIRVGDDQRVRSEAIVVATNTPINNLVAMHTKQAPYMTYVIGGAIPRGVISDALFWDTLEPYHYVRLQRLNDQYDLLIIGGEDHKTGQANDGWERFMRLEEWARERFAQLGDIVYRWSGQFVETIDGLAFIGRNPLDEDNVFIATGDSGMGMTHGTIAGIVLTALIQGNHHPWERLYDPSRKTTRGLGRFAQENLNVAVQYTDWVIPGDVSSVDEIPSGEGAVVRRGLSKVAVYRDDSGKTHTLSAICPHLACIVHWNGVQKTWDCPCHGSRFSCLGHVICGPANSDLRPFAE